FELVSGEHLLDAGANLPNASPLRPRGWRPFVARPGGAFGEAEATPGTTEMAAMRLHRGAKLEVDGFVAREERQIAVRGRARDDLDVAVAFQLGERPRNVAADAPVQLPHSLVHVLPEMSQEDGFFHALPLEVL